MDTPRGSIDIPAPGSEIGAGLVTLLGWAGDARGAVVVDLEVDGRIVERACPGNPRPDVTRAFGLPALAFCGWEALVDLHALAERDTVRVAAVARSADGRPWRVAEATYRIATARGARPEAGPSATAVPRADGPRGTAPASSRGAVPTRLLAIMHNLDPAGSQRLLLERLSAYTASHGARAVVVSPRDGLLRRAFEAAGIACHIAGPLRGATADDQEARVEALRAWAAPQGFELVVASSEGASPGIEVARRLGVPSVWLLYAAACSKRHYFRMTQATPAHVKAQAEAALEQASLVVFDSVAAHDGFRSHVSHDRHRTIPGAIDLTDIERFRARVDRAAERKKRSIPEDAVVVLSLGSSLAFKGAGVLLQAFAAIARERADLRLALIGSGDGEFGEALRASVREQGLEHRVRVEPAGDEAYAWLSVADLLVSASDREGMPRVVMEAMAFEVPVVTTRVGDVASAIEDGVTGWMVEHRDPFALESAMRRALSAPVEERKRIAGNALAVVRKHRGRERADEGFAEALRWAFREGPR